MDKGFSALNSNDCRGMQEGSIKSWMSRRGQVGNNNFVLFPAAELEAIEDSWQCSDSDKPKGMVLEDVLSL